MRAIVGETVRESEAVKVRDRVTERVVRQRVSVSLYSNASFWSCHCHAMSLSCIYVRVCISINHISAYSYVYSHNVQSGRGEERRERPCSQRDTHTQRETVIDRVGDERT